MLEDSVNSFVKSSFTGVGFILLVLLFILLAPCLLIWVVNSIAESIGYDFYVAHTVWNYFLAFIFLVLIRGGK